MKKFILFILIFTSNEFFAQWFPLSSGTSSQLNKIEFIDINTGIGVGVGSVIIRTTNSGNNWTNLPNPAGVNLWNLAIRPSGIIYVCGDNVVIKSTDFGNNWTTLSPSAAQYRGIYFHDDNTGYICGSNGNLIKTTDGGLTWNTLPGGTTQWLFAISFAGPSTGFCSGFSGTIIKTTNSGNNWSALSTGITENIFSVFAVNTDTVYAAGFSGRIIKSTNGGISWSQQISGTTEQLNQIYFINSNTGSVCGFGNVLLRTTNGGLNWHMQSGLSGQGFVGIRFVNLMTGFTCGTSGTILKTTTGGFPFPSAPNLISPPNGATGVSLTPLLDWDSVTTAKTYRLQLATDSVFINPLIDSSGIVQSHFNVTSGLLTNNTTYFWRVRGINAAGEGPWSGTFRFRTIMALPNPPGLILPANNSSGISLTPYFDWDSTSPVSFYRIQISVDSSFSVTHADFTGITRSDFTLNSPPLSHNFRYYWRVNATNEAGTGPWSVRFNFTTLLGPPAAPILLSPPNYASGISLTPLLDWNEDISVTSYQLQLSGDSLFSSLVIDSSGFAVSHLLVRPGLLNNLTTYFWRVRTTNSFGTGPWSIVFRFTTALSPPNAPVLLSPPNNDTNVSTTPTLDWNDVPFASSYRVQLSADSTFGTTLINIGGLTVSQYNVSGGILNNNTRYFWRVNATNSMGTGPWSVIWNFRTVTSPPVAPPVLISPPNGAIGQSLTPLLDWNDVVNADGYRVNLSNDSLFNTVLIDTNVTVSNYSVRAGLLSGNVTYYWRVRAFNSGGSGPWSLTWRFTTQPIGIIKYNSEIPDRFMLHQNIPNPFNPITKIRFDVPKRINANIAIYNINGSLIETLSSGEIGPGSYEITWNAAELPSGVYFCRFNSIEYSSSLKLILLK
ncbi:MAG: YCF48-related protein [Ignavibacteria bacterium]|nr:YCF48-related protein [Ignavibacteria bacterium]